MSAPHVDPFDGKPAVPEADSADLIEQSIVEPLDDEQYPVTDR